MGKNEISPKCWLRYYSAYFLELNSPRWRCLLQASPAGMRKTQMKLHRAVRLLAFALLLSAIPILLSSQSAAQFAIGVNISVQIEPPALPVYEQPICPQEGYMWTPGYWAWDDDDGYYWVPGTWVSVPEPGLLWTPGYWGWNDGVYAWNGGYWGPHVGFYGGVNYGFGYGGAGFGGGEWRGGSFFYNTAVVHVNTVSITNVYVNKTVIVNNESHVAFNGGQGGVQARPTPQEEQYAHETHTPPVAAQVQQAHVASQNKALFASNNHGRPAVAATAKPGVFSGPGVVTAKAAGAPYHAPTISPKEARVAAPAGNKGAENRPAANRPAENHAPPAGGAKAANRPAPKSNAKPAGANRPEANRPENERPAAAHPAPAAKESHPTESHPAKAPVPSSHASAPREESAPKESAPKASASHPAPRASAKPAAEPKPAAAPKHESAPKPAAPKASAPKAAARPAPAPKPAAAPKPAKPSAPPKKEPPPKEEHK
jgi:YXWGXW repeat-containing protein